LTINLNLHHNFLFVHAKQDKEGLIGSFESKTCIFDASLSLNRDEKIEATYFYNANFILY